MSENNNFTEIALADLKLNPFEAIGKDWLLITAGDAQKANTMTASWGGMGVLWNENVAFVFIRPQRYTKEFVDAKGCFSLSFFQGQREALSLLGSVSGRDRDKIAESGLHLTMLDGVPAFAEARLVLLTDTLYTAELEPTGFLKPEYIQKCYPQADFHTMYVAKIRRAYAAQ